MPVYGIDVSHWQGAIDWAKVKAAGKDFAIIKASEGTTWTDSRFAGNWRETKQEGIVRGAYHYFRPGLDNGAQAANFYRVVGEPQPGDLIPWLDVEDFKTSVNGQAMSPQRTAVDVSETLLHMDKLFGLRVGVYTGLWFWDQLPVAVVDRPLWVAFWYSDGKPGNPKLPKGFGEWHIHQYTSKGRVPGISGDVDLNWMPGAIGALQVQPDMPARVDIKPQLTAIRSALDEIERVVV